MKTDDARTKTKGEHLSLRIQARAKFAIEYWAPVVKQSATSFVETAIEEHAKMLTKLHGHQWRSIFHPHAGVREVRMYLLEGYPFDDGQAKRREFVLEHRAFFYRQAGKHLEANAPFIETLWHPKTALDAWQARGAKRYWDSGKAMGEALRARGFEPPEWPPKEA